MESYQEEMDALFVRLFGSWDNPILHASSEVLASAEESCRWYDAISKARHYAKKEYPILDEFIRVSVSGISKSTETGVLVIRNASATGAVQRDPKTLVPFIQIMQNETYKLMWLNMSTFKGFVGTQYWENGLKEEW